MRRLRSHLAYEANGNNIILIIALVCKAARMLLIFHRFSPDVFILVISQLCFRKMTMVTLLAIIDKNGFPIRK